MSKRCQALETISNKSTGRAAFDASNSSQKAKNPSTQLRQINHVITSNQSCIHCKNKHFIFQCELFCKLPIEKRFEIVKNTHLCINCLRSSTHQARNCASSSCRKCGKAYNTLLHFESTKIDNTKIDSQPVVPSSNSTNTPPTNALSPVVTQCSQISNASKIFLSTAVVNVYDRKEQPHGCRVLLNSGSQLNFVTEDFINKLQLDTRNSHISMSEVAEGTFELKRMVNIWFRSRTSAYTNNLKCIILPKITQRLPQEFCPMSEFKIPSNITLADPNFNIPSEIDLLIGAQVFWQLICVG